MKRIISCILKGCPGIFLFFPCVGQNLTVVRDSTFCFKSHLSPERVMTVLPNVAFSKVTDCHFNFGFTSDDYCYILLKAEADQPSADYKLSIDNTSLDTLEIFSLHSNGSGRLLYQGGNLMNYDKDRDYVWHTCSLAVSQVPHFYLIAIKALSKNVNLHYRIIKSRDLMKLYRDFDRVVSFYVGVVSLIILISFIAFLLLGYKQILIYLGYLVSISVWILTHYGYFFPWFHPSFPVINHIIKIVSSLLATIFFLYLIFYLFKNDIVNKKWRNLILGLVVVNCLFIGLSLAHLVFIFSTSFFTYLNITWHILLVLSVCASVPVLFSLFNSGSSARIFCFAAVCPFLMLFVQILSNEGYLTNALLNNHGVLLANLLEIIILLSGIIYNIWNKEKSKDEQLRLSEEDRKETLKKLITVQDQERRRVAEELHDSIGPMLAAIKINFLRSINAERESRSLRSLIVKTEGIIDESISEIRNMSHQLMPKGLSSKGLVTLLTEYFDNLENLYSININFTSSITLMLSSDVQLNLYRIISELVLNATRHGGAHTVVVSLLTQKDEIDVVTRDDGIGFVAMKKNVSGLGLKSIESRVSYLKGVLEIQSSPGNGSCIKISIPHQDG